jgi:chromatin segregation and condensation protein Rec8/ScpA/Scc1 (kleisin family)
MSERIVNILHSKSKKSILSVLVACAESKSALVATFMAMLELIRERKILIIAKDAENIDDSVYLTLNDKLCKA